MAAKATALEQPSIYKPILILAAAVVLLAGVHFAASMLLPIMMGSFFGVLLAPIYGWLNRRIPRGLALLLSIGFSRWRRFCCWC